MAAWRGRSRGKRGDKLWQPRRQGPRRYDPDENEVSFVDPAATFGGPILRDKAWFFVSAEQVDSEATPTESPSTRNFEGTNLMAKATWQANQEWSVVGRWLSEDATIDNANADQTVAGGATRFQEQPAGITRGATRLR